MPCCMRSTFYAIPCILKRCFVHARSDRVLRRGPAGTIVYNSFDAVIRVHLAGADGVDVVFERTSRDAIVFSDAIATESGFGVEKNRRGEFAGVDGFVPVRLRACIAAFGAEGPLAKQSD